MPRTARAAIGGICYHVINRGNGRAKVFHADGDYRYFVDLLGEAVARHDMRLLAYCLMPNHFHLLLWPRADGDLSRFMQWLMTAHVRPYHAVHRTSGHLWQGRFKAFPIQEDGHLLNVMRYVEANALRARLVRRAEAWPWSSLRVRREGDISMHDGPVPLPTDWLAIVNSAAPPDELTRLRDSVNRGAPFGEEKWAIRTATRLGLESTLRSRGRPRKRGHS